MPLVRCLTRARIRPSAVNRLICVSSVNEAGRAGAVTPPGPNRLPISVQLRNSTGWPSASPTAPASKQPVSRFRRSTSFRLGPCPRS